ncbi:MAG: hypothetical protein FWH04_07945 [Oscillospiraceae bacterium]|nr:hypothetical protein [Oscillospiraceae bacterium]
MANHNNSELEKNMVKDKHSLSGIQADNSVNLPMLLFFTLLGMIFLSAVGLVFSALGFIAAPPIGNLASATLFALLCLPLYRLFLLTSETKNFLAARISVGISSAVVAYIYLGFNMSILETLYSDVDNMEASDFAEILDVLQDAAERFFVLYFLHPLLLLESYLYYNDAWVVLMAVLLSAMISLGQLATGGVKDRSRQIQQDFDDDLQESQAAFPEGGQDDTSPEKKKKEKKKRGAKTSSGVDQEEE